MNAWNAPTATIEWIASGRDTKKPGLSPRLFLCPTDSVGQGSETFDQQEAGTRGALAGILGGAVFR